MQRARTFKTNGYIEQPLQKSSVMPIEIASVVRQTLWRWRKARRIPQRRNHGDQNVVFTRAEVEAIREYSSRLALADSPQLLRQNDGGRVMAPTDLQQRVVS